MSNQGTPKSSYINDPTNLPYSPTGHTLGFFRATPSQIVRVVWYHGPRRPRVTFSKFIRVLDTNRRKGQAPLSVYLSSWNAFVHFVEMADKIVKEFEKEQGIQ